MKRAILISMLTVLLASPALAVDPYSKADGTWITLSGTVKSVTRDAFVMKYDDGVITVEMDDGDRDADAYKLLTGDEVIVSGMIDDDFFETTTIEASSVYVKKLNTTFYASAVDDESFYFDPVYWVEPTKTVVSGKVTRVNGHEFMLDTGKRMMTVDVENMAYNPLDDKGYQKVRKGDRVSVTGKMDYDLFEGRELDAESVIVLRKKDMNGGSAGSR